MPFETTAKQFQAYDRYEKVVMDGHGNIKVIPLRRGVGNGVFIDTVSFTFHISSLNDYGRLFSGLANPFTNRDYAVRWSLLAVELFGFGVSSSSPVGGGRFYDERWEMSLDGVLYGQFYIGGQKDTVLIELTGRGCEVAKDGWEKRLFDFLSQAVKPKITRCDVSRDFFNGEITPDSAYQSWLEGGFNIRGKAPSCERYGRDWDCGTNDGKTFYVGSKQSARYVRIYDKAKEQGDKSSFWTRFEIQFTKHAVIDLEILIVPIEFFVGSFQICELLNQGIENKRVLSTKKRLEMSVDRCKEVAASQVGRAVNMMLELNMTAEQIVEFLRNKDGKLPERVNPASYMLPNGYLKFIQDEYEGAISLDFDEYSMMLEDDEYEQMLVIDEIVQTVERVGEVKKLYPCVLLDELDPYEKVLTFHLSDSRFVTVYQVNTEKPYKEEDYIKELFDSWAKSLNIYGYHVEFSGNVKVTFIPKTGR